MRVVLDTCILKLATFPIEDNASALASFLCYPLTELHVIRHEPDNRFLECALAASADFIVTVNTAPGHFDRRRYQTVSVVRPGEYLNLPEVVRRVKRLSGSSG